MLSKIIGNFSSVHSGVLNEWFGETMRLTNLILASSALLLVSLNSRADEIATYGEPLKEEYRVEGKSFSAFYRTNEIGDAFALERLSNAVLEEATPEVQVSAILALGRHPLTDASRETLEMVARDSDPHVRNAATNALAGKFLEIFWSYEIHKQPLWGCVQGKTLLQP